MSQIADGGKVKHQTLQKIVVGKSRGTLANRILLVSVLSILITSFVALAISFPVLRQTSDNQTRSVLADQADTLANVVLLGPNTDLGEQLLRDLVREFESSGRGEGGFGHRGNRDGLPPGVVVVPVATDSEPTGPITATDIAAVVSGENVSYKTSGLAINYFVEGRALGPGQGVFLIQQTSIVDSNVRELLAGTAIALAVGLMAAILLARFVARRTAKPMHEAAAAATALAAGDRKVELTIDGPVEVADISNALNLLATNLANSEDRQREFLMSISHELRTPLTSLKGYSEALADGMINADENADVGKLMMGETARLERLISDLLDLARMQAVEFRLENSTINLNEIVESAVEAWRITADKAGINFEFTTLAADAAGDASIEADVTRVRQMLDNLLENAIKVVGPGGMVRLTLETRAREFVVAVEDDGPGLADSDYEVAFEPAVLHNKYKHQRSGGSGLGLALVGTLARRMGAAVTAGPSELGGAKFELQFAKSTAEISPN